MFLCSLDPQKVPSVEGRERLLTTCMLQVVSALTLRSIKNTGTCTVCFISIVLALSPLFSLRRGRNHCCILTFCMFVPVSVRDLGMVPYIKIFLDEDQYRAPTLSILEQLAEINPEEFMSTAIGAICSSTQQELRLKWDLLQVLEFFMHSSHRPRHTNIQKHKWSQLNSEWSLHSTSNHNQL